MSSSAGAKVAYVTSEPQLPQWEDDQLSAEVLADREIKVEFVPWDDPHADWNEFDLAVVRSPWDYADRLEEFLAWADSVGPEKLRNTPEVLRWNTDKRYLAELDGSGLPVPPTVLIVPHGPVPDLGGRVVVKPVTGAGARDTGTFSDESRDGALELLARLGDQDEVAMIQQYIDEIDEVGETAVLFFGGRFAYALRKQPFLPGVGVATPKPGTQVAAAMFEEDLVTLTEATEEEIDLGLKTLGWLSNRFHHMPLYARIDMVSTRRGPVLMEVELAEPSLYLSQTTSLDVPGAVLFAEAVIRELE
ncbi:MAG: ATP-grasp domain-containing protein [Solirubrobacterales bacterium]